MKTGEALKAAVKAAVKHSVGEIVANHPGESLNGYAILTDDELRTLGHLASTDELSQELTQEEPSSRFQPVDWTYDDGSSAFDQPRELLVAGADAATSSDMFSAHVDESFAALVAALRELKSEGLFDDSVFLTVISTDPNEHLERLEDGAARTLNSPELYREWKASIA